MLVKCTLDGKLYAMKKISKKLIQETNNIQATKNERDVLFKTIHPFVVSAHFCFQTSTCVFIILDYVKGGNLFERLKEEMMFSESRTRLYAAEIALGLEYLHKLGYIYRDLKPQNILIGSDGYIKISDLGFTRKYNPNIDTFMTFCGTPEFISPEMIQRKPYNESVDWWSFGILVFNMLTGTSPFYNENVNKMYKMIINDDIDFPSFVSPVAKQFISKLLEKDPDRRLGSGEFGFETIKNHPFFEGLNWDDLLNKRIAPEWIPEDKCEENEIITECNFTNNDTIITFEDSSLIDKKTQDEFVGFSFVDKNNDDL